MVELNLATAQALCLLQIHETVASSDNGPPWSSRYHGKAHHNHILTTSFNMLTSEALSIQTSPSK